MTMEYFVLVSLGSIKRVGAELLVLGGLGGDKGEVLGRDDLVGVNVVADDVAEAVEGGGSGGGGGGEGRCGV
jgi:hypothetical protein